MPFQQLFLTPSFVTVDCYSNFMLQASKARKGGRMASENKTSRDMVKSLNELGVDLSNVKEVIALSC